MVKLANKTILMIEDNYENIIVQKAYLEKAGARVHIFTGGTLDDIKTKLPLDIIIMDLMMPGSIDGFDFFEILAQDAQLSSIPVLAVSAMDSSVAIPKAKSAGFKGFIAKPVDVDRFAEQVADVLNGKAAWDANRY